MCAIPVIEVSMNILARLPIKSILVHVNEHYGAYGFVAVVVIALVIGVYLGYTPEQIITWMGL